MPSKPAAASGPSKAKAPGGRARKRPTGAGGGITPDLVLDAASKIVEGEGLEALTMRRLAGDLGVAPPTIYWHVGNKDELIDKLLNRLAADLDQVKAVGRTPKARIMSVMLGLRTQIGSHPALAALAWTLGSSNSLYLHAQTELVRELRKTNLPNRSVGFALHNLLAFYACFHLFEHILPTGDSHTYHFAGPDQVATMLGDADAELTASLSADADIDQIYRFQLEALIDHLLALS